LLKCDVIYSFHDYTEIFELLLAERLLSAGHWIAHGSVWAHLVLPSLHSDKVLQAILPKWPMEIFISSIYVYADLLLKRLDQARN
jgi:hypothetical protein